MPPLSLLPPPPESSLLVGPESVVVESSVVLVDKSVVVLIRSSVVVEVGVIRLVVEFKDVVDRTSVVVVALVPLTGMVV